ncbi:MAG: amidase [Chloroflexi bacterium]|nr:amidase [Chloroflexota bacterium]
MPDRGSESPLYWPVASLIAAYRAGRLSPVEVADDVLARIDRLNPSLHAYLVRFDDLTRRQAREAEAAYRAGRALPLSGVPISIKDTFPLAGAVTTFGSAVHRHNVTQQDSGVVRRLRAAGAVFTGKTNTAEFGQSATSDNRLGPEASNPWDTTRTLGGSSGGAAVSVAAGLASLALAADGGGSIRIPASFTGLLGFKPTYGLIPDEGGLSAMSAFVCPGPLAWRAADARAFLGARRGRRMSRARAGRGLRIAWCPRPEGRPVDPGVAATVSAAVARLEILGHEVVETALPLEGWNEAFGPLVLAEERRERGDLLDRFPDMLSDYVRRSLVAARTITDDDIAAGRAAHRAYRARVAALFESWDAIATPATAVTAFPFDKRPKRIAGREVDWLWGAFPFAVPFNVSGNPAVSLPCGLADGLPVGLQLVMPLNEDERLLDLAEDMEEALAFDRRSMGDPAPLPAVEAAS